MQLLTNGTGDGNNAVTRAALPTLCLLPGIPVSRPPGATRGKRTCPALLQPAAATET